MKKHQKIFYRLLVAFFFLLISNLSFAGNGIKGTTITLQPAATVSWSDILKQAKESSFQENQQPRVMPFMPAPPKKDIGAPREGYTFPSPANKKEESAPTVAIPPFSIQKSFLALPDNGIYIPPDTMGAVGPNHIMTMLNSQVRIQDKSGNTIGDIISLKNFWNPLGISYVCDPIIIYDSLSKRWLAVAIADWDDDAKVLFAITQSNNPTGTWYYYSITADTNGNNMADYPRVGLNSKWIAITANMFNKSNHSYVGPKMWVIDKSTVLGGDSMTLTTFNTGFDDTGKGEGFTLTPAVTFDPNEANLYLVDNWYFRGTVIRLSKISGTASSPTWSIVSDSKGPFPGNGLFYVVNGYNDDQINASQKGTTTRIMTDDERIINAVYRNGRLWFVHSGGLPQDNTEEVNPDRTAIFWYQVDPSLLDSTGNPIVQSGVIDPGAGGHVFFPSIAVNKNNDVVIGFSHSDSTRYVETSFVSRSASYPQNSVSQITTIKLGEAIYRKDFGHGRIRWGDYSATVVDPSDGTTFWTIQEYAATPVSGGTTNDDRWGTWWAKIVPPSGGSVTKKSKAMPWLMLLLQ